MMKNLVGDADMKMARILGAGFSCVDIINYDGAQSFGLGGTAANVMTILSQFGFDSHFLTADYIGKSGEWYKHALENRKIKPVFFQKSKKNISKVFEEVKGGNGDHYFRTMCPMCGNRFVNVILPTDKQIKDIERELGDFNLFFYDRFSTGINALAQANDKGWNVYEPNSFRMYHNLLNGCKVADVIKFSSERIPDKICQKLLSDLKTSRAKIVIVSLGKNGLKFSIKEDELWGKWELVSGVETEKVIDAAGAGDWLTAGFIYELLLNYKNQKQIDAIGIKNMLQKAQKLAATACEYKGAQGILKESEGIALLRNTIKKPFFWKINDLEFDEDVTCPKCGFK